MVSKGLAAAMKKAHSTVMCCHGRLAVLVLYNVFIIVDTQYCYCIMYFSLEACNTAMA